MEMKNRRHVKRLSVCCRYYQLDGCKVIFFCQLFHYPRVAQYTNTSITVRAIYKQRNSTNVFFARWFCFLFFSCWCGPIRLSRTHINTNTRIQFTAHGRLAAQLAIRLWNLIKRFFAHLDDVHIVQRALCAVAPKFHGWRQQIQKQHRTLSSTIIVLSSV